MPTAPLDDGPHNKPSDPYPVPLDDVPAIPPSDPISDPAFESFGGESVWPEGDSPSYSMAMLEATVGRVPPPAFLRQYKEMYPPAAEIVWEAVRADTTMARDEQAYRHEMGREALRSTFTLAQRGQDRAYWFAVLAAILSATIMLVGILAAEAAASVAGGAALIGSIGAVVAIFVTGQQSASQERIEKERIRSGQVAADRSESPQNDHP